MAPYGARVPYQLMIAPRTPRPASRTRAQRRRMLRDALSRLTHAWAPPRR